ncbi:MAG: hypothetical protein ACKVKI_03600, partial [Flavobacteriales bacterium]
MKQYFSALLIVLFLAPAYVVLGQCVAGESEVVVQILTDNYPAETTWTLSDASGALLSGGPYQGTNTTYTASTCIPNTGDPSCLQFVIDDSYGDGICCGYG